jgi:hypothetical protein
LPFCFLVTRFNVLKRHLRKTEVGGPWNLHSWLWKLFAAVAIRAVWVYEIERDADRYFLNTHRPWRSRLRRTTPCPRSGCTSGTATSKIDMRQSVVFSCRRVGTTGTVEHDTLYKKWRDLSHEMIIVARFRLKWLRPRPNE